MDPDKTKDGPVSLNPSQLKELVDISKKNQNEIKDYIKNNIDELNLLIGNSTRKLSDKEKLNRDYYRGRFARYHLMEIIFLTGKKKKFSKMCGFFFIKKNGIEYNLNILKKYSNLIKHRGPDDDRIYNDKFIYSRFFRLSILDTSSKASQPMFDVSKRYMLLFNGEIYNFKDLKKIKV